MPWDEERDLDLASVGYGAQGEREPELELECARLLDSRSGDREWQDWETPRDLNGREGIMVKLTWLRRVLGVLVVSFLVS